MMESPCKNFVPTVAGILTPSTINTLLIKIKALSLTFCRTCKQIMLHGRQKNNYPKECTGNMMCVTLWRKRTAVEEEKKMRDLLSIVICMVIQKRGLPSQALPTEKI